MSLIQSYVVRQLLVSTGMVSAILLVVIWLAAAIRVMDFIVSQGLALDTFLLLTLYSLPKFLPVVLPMALFVAVLWIYHRLVSDSELVVMRAAGLSDVRLCIPALIVGILVSAIVAYLNFSVAPAAARAFKELEYLQRYDFSAMLIQPGAFRQVQDGVTFYVREQGENQELSGILIHDERDPATRTTLMAEHGKLVIRSDGPRVILQNGNRQQVSRDTGRTSLLYFDQYTLDLKGMAREMDERWRDARERSLTELLSAEAPEFWERHVREFRAEAHHRIVSVFFTLSVTLVALTILLYGEFNRRGYFWRLLTAALVAPSILWGSFLLRSVIVRTPEATPLLYVAAILPAFVSLGILAFPRRVRLAPRARAEARADTAPA